MSRIPGGAFETSSSPNPTVGVMLVDGRAVVREGLRAVIEPQPDLVVVAQAATVRHAGSLDVTPDVIVTDIDLPDAKSGDVISALRRYFQRSSILVFTPIGHPAEVQSVLTAGARGYLLETASTDDVLTGIRAVAGGETYLQPSLGVDLARLHQARDATVELLPLEEQVLRLLALGHTNTEVARLCNMSLRSAESYRAQVQRKLGRRTRAELVAYAREHGLIELGAPPVDE
jgi:two-component system, NarL family, response regulator NreC